jgi:hypothetical protein
MIKITQCNSRLAGQVDQRQDEKYQRHNKQNGNAIFMGQMQHGAHEGNDDQQRCDDGAYDGIEYRLVEQFGPELETGDILLEVRFGVIVIDDTVQELRSITRFMREISTEMNAATAPSRNAGAATLPIMRASCSIDGANDNASLMSATPTAPPSRPCRENN